MLNPRCLCSGSGGLGVVLAEGHLRIIHSIMLWTGACTADHQGLGVSGLSLMAQFTVDTWACVGSSITKNTWSWPTHSTGCLWGGVGWGGIRGLLVWDPAALLFRGNEEWGGLWLTPCLPGIQTPWASLGTRCSTALSTVSPPASLTLHRALSPSSWVARPGQARAHLVLCRPPPAWQRPRRQPPPLPPRPRPPGLPRRSQGRPQRPRPSLPAKTWRRVSRKCSGWTCSGHAEPEILAG